LLLLTPPTDEGLILTNTYKNWLNELFKAH
jgi:hypothetical protein